MKYKGIFLLVTLALVTVLIGACGPETTPTSTQPAEVIEWKLSQFGPPHDAAADALRWYGDELNKRSDGRIEVEYFFGASLMPGADHPEGFKQGMVQMACVYTGYHPSLTPLLHLHSLPLLFPSLEVKKEVYINVCRTFNEWCQEPSLKAELANWNAQYIGNFVPIWWSLMSTMPWRKVRHSQPT